MYLSLTLTHTSNAIIHCVLKTVPVVLRLSLLRLIAEHHHCGRPSFAQHSSQVCRSFILNNHLSKMKSAHKDPSGGNATLFDRIAPVTALVFSFIVSIVVIFVSSVPALGGFRDNIEDHRTTVSVVVQLLATVIGLLQINILTGVIRASFSLYISTKPIRLDTIGLFNALIIPRVSWSLPWTSIFIALSMLIVA